MFCSEERLFTPYYKILAVVAEFDFGLRAETPFCLWLLLWAISDLSPVLLITIIYYRVP